MLGSQIIPISFQEQAETFWFESYNDPNSLWPVLSPATFWVGVWIMYRFVYQKDYSKWYFIHTLHHVVALMFGCTSLYYDDNSIFHERIGILWSASYFIVDILECILTGHLTYILHGAICLGLGLCNYHIPLLQTLRMNSKATFIESSSILLYQVKQNRNPTLFLLFAINYTCCRILWIPCMVKELYENGLTWNHPIMLALGAFYILQLHWWVKILKILWKGKGKGHDDDDDGDNDNNTKKEEKQR